MYLTLCRVCGVEFSSRRFDSVTCTSTCRQRLRRGQAFAYLAEMTKRQQKTEREKHARIDAFIAFHKETNKTVRRKRSAKRQKRFLKTIRQKAIEDLANIKIAELRHGDYWQFKKLQMAVAAVLTLFVKQRRNDFSAEAIAEFLNIESYTVEAITDAIDVLKQEGHYDRIMSGDFGTKENLVESESDPEDL